MKTVSSSVLMTHTAWRRSGHLLAHSHTLSSLRTAQGGDLTRTGLTTNHGIQHISDGSAPAGLGGAPFGFHISVYVPWASLTKPI